jgi:membrane protease YdiL (CAAX protease family)
MSGSLMDSALALNAATMRRTARRGLALYLGIVVALSAPLELIIIGADLDGGANNPALWLLLIAGLMAVPTIASFTARFALREGFADVSFRPAGRIPLVWALCFPLLIALPSYGIGWASGLVEFALPPAGPWIAALALLSTLNLVLVSGEEIGWRGYMLTRLIDAGVPHPVLVSGLIWGLWHVPLVLWAGYADGPSPALSVATLVLTAVALGSVLARIRLETGSIWPPIVMHAAWNVTLQAGFDPATAGPDAALWVGETGILTVLALTAGAAITNRRRWRAAQTDT